MVEGHMSQRREKHNQFQTLVTGQRGEVWVFHGVHGRAHQPTIGLLMVTASPMQWGSTTRNSGVSGNHSPGRDRACPGKRPSISCAWKNNIAA